MDFIGIKELFKVIIKLQILEIIPNDIPCPQEIQELTIRRVVLQNWANSGVNKFILLWNQRDSMEHMYGDIQFIPALFSKGRPFDDDHIVARNRLLYENMRGIGEVSIRNGIMQMMAKCSISANLSDITKESIITNDGGLRKSFPNLIGNYRYWPKCLNRHDQDKSVTYKMNLAEITAILKDNPLKSKFQSMNDPLWRWSAIPSEDKDVWLRLPPDDEWNQNSICDFLTSVLKRERFLYSNAYRFITNDYTVS